MLRISVLAVLPVLLVVICVYLGRITGTTTISNESKVRVSLERYEKIGLLKTSLFQVDPGFWWPKKTFTFPAGPRTEKTTQDIQEQLSKQTGPPVLELPIAEFVEQVGLLFAKGTQYEGKFQVNGTPRNDFINLYLIDRDPDGVAKYFNKNCEYIGYQNAIICDSSLFKTYFSFIDGIKKTYDIDFRDVRTGEKLPLNAKRLATAKVIVKQSILVWVLGHEIGHAVLHKHVLMQDNVRLHFDLEYNEYEKQADGFVANRLIQDWGLTTNYWLGSGEFIQQEFRRLYRERANEAEVAKSQIDYRDFVLENKIVVPYSKYNVPMLLRATRIINAILAADSRIDSTGFYKQVANNINVVAISPNRYRFWLWVGVSCLLGFCVLAYYFWSVNPGGEIPYVDHG